jgi:diaminohydroxyphosphoribosylaminopyrimidine deaminase/5-amino-6-(5-phosphoribosylamino)uracil reductase
MTPERDEDRMRQAVAVAATARRTVSPRPWVGAVLVSADGDVFTGATEGQAGPHAEVVAITAADAAGTKSQGATLYVTLEPCAHVGRTGPCADAVIAAGITRCVVGIVDPDPRVAGEGIDRLRRAGIDVTVGVARGEVNDQLAPYLTHRRTGRPHVVLKLAATLDGRTAAADGTSQWITGAQARYDAHRLRADSDAIVVGAGTVRVDDPSLTVRLDPDEVTGTPPLRVVLGHAPAAARVQPCLEYQGPIEALLDDLGRRGVLQLMVEGGASVAHAFHQGGLVDRYVLYLAPALAGGDDARGLFAGAGAPSLDGLWRGEIVDVRRIGPDLRLDVVAPGRRTQQEQG